MAQRHAYTVAQHRRCATIQRQFTMTTNTHTADALAAAKLADCADSLAAKAARWAKSAKDPAAAEQLSATAELMTRQAVAARFSAHRLAVLAILGPNPTDADRAWLIQRAASHAHGKVLKTGNFFQAYLDASAARDAILST